MQRAVSGKHSTDPAAKNDAKASKTEDSPAHGHKKNEWWCSIGYYIYRLSIVDFILF